MLKYRVDFAFFSAIKTGAFFSLFQKTTKSLYKNDYKTQEKKYFN